MTEKELQTYLQKRFPCENEACDWKEMKSLKNCLTARKAMMSSHTWQPYQA